MLTKLLEQMRALQRSSSYLLEYPTDIEGLLEQNRRIKAALGGYIKEYTVKPTVNEDDINVLKTTVAMYKLLCSNIADECEKVLGRKMDSEGLYKYVCDALNITRDI